MRARQDANRIHVLDKDTVNRIAAGEVVERPASVVKELWENAADAGATRVEVALQEGGRRLIRVHDDGYGMSAGDARASLQRHATSKIRHISDLGRLDTLGFRGEALPSIAAVSRLTILTCEAGNFIGTRLEAEGGTITVVDESGYPPGTTVSVSDLFYNTPARQAQLREPGAELAACTEVLAQAALARPDLALVAHHATKGLMLTPGRGDLREAVAAVHGPELARALLDVMAESPDVRIEGLLGPPDVSRAGRAWQHFFINGRPAKNAGLRKALEDCFRSVLPSGRYPVAFLHLRLPPDRVDANIHPSKAEVRFLDERPVLDAVREAVGRALGAGILAVAPLQPRPRAGTASGPAAALAPDAGPGLVAEAAGPEWSAGGPPAGGAAPRRGPEAPRPHAGRSPVAREELAALEPLGQVLKTYLVAAGPDGLYLLDQHAAHERVYFEAFLSRPDERAAQPLLVPFTVELAPPDLALLEARPQVMAAMGFELEPFGGAAVLVRSVPASLAGRAGPVLVRDAIERWRQSEEEGGRGEARTREEVAALVIAACRAAIKAHQGLSREEARALLRELAACELPHTCPHGRPTLARLGRRDLARLFGRS